MILFKRKPAGISYGVQEAFALFNQRQLEIIDLLQTEDKVSVSELTQRFGVARAMAKSAKKMIVLATSDKVGANAVASSFPLSAVHTVITDSDLAPEGRSLLDQAGVEVITV